MRLRLYDLWPHLACGVLNLTGFEFCWGQTSMVAPMMHQTMFQWKLTLKVLVATIDAQWEGMGDVGSARYEPALLPPCPTIRVLSYSNQSIFKN